jgi:hypothetical protein
MIISVFPAKVNGKSYPDSSAHQFFPNSVQFTAGVEAAIEHGRGSGHPAKKRSASTYQADQRPYRVPNPFTLLFHTYTPCFPTVLPL